jgi:hypothetical protein
MRRLLKISQKARRGMAIETAIYTMVVVFIMISTIMYVAVNMVKDDITNNDAFIEKYAAIDQIGEEFVANVFGDGEFDTNVYTGYLVTVTDNNLEVVVVESSTGKTVLVVKIDNGKVVKWTH